MQEKKGKNRPVFVDSKALSKSREEALGRPLSPVEKSVINTADAILIDSLACGRNVATTVRNYEIHGGKLPAAVKAILGLAPSPN